MVRDGLRRQERHGQIRRRGIEASRGEGRFVRKKIRIAERIEIEGIRIARIFVERIWLKREVEEKLTPHAAYSFNFFKYSRNDGPNFSFFSANSTVASKNPSLSPASYVLP